MTDDRDDGGRIRRIRLAHMRQELLAPVSAILGYGEMLDEAARDGGHDEVVPDLERILTAARALHDMVDRLLDPAAAEGLFDGKDAAEVQKVLRHDLRTPLNAIKGYGEMLLEDLEDMGAPGLKADFGALISEADRLLAQLDSVVDFSAAEALEDAGEEAARSAVMFARIAESIRPEREAGSKAAETGKILVVDDLESNRDVLSRRLARDGHRVEVASGGREALRRIASEDFDLVLLDLMMPDMNGFEVLTRLKADERLHETPVIMVSALDEMDSVVR
ncbi:MAG: response regulator, partial [Kiloniellales bacterium]